MPTWSCYDCDCTFNNQNGLIQHRKATGHRYQWDCDGCDRVFASPKAIQQHCEALHKRECGDCGRIFKSERALEQHVETVHEWECDECDRVFKSECALERHVEATHTYSCKLCSRGFCNKNALQQHKRDKHTSTNQQQLVLHRTPAQQAVQLHQPPLVAQQTFTCNLYQYNYLTYNIQECSHFHESAYHSWRCDVCGIIHRTEDALQQHKRTTHNFSCSNCQNTTFPTAEFLQQHMSIYHNWKCTIEGCNQAFIILASLEEHKKDQHSIPCLVTGCGKVCTTPEVLRQHTLAKHMFPCTICRNRNFSTLQEFQKHNMQVHGRKCGPCKLSFGTRTALETHNATRHTIHCYACEKDFQSESYDYHLGSLEHLSNATGGRSTVSRSVASDNTKMTCAPAPQPTLSTPGPEQQKTNQSSLVKCGKCSAMFNDIDALQQHFGDAHLYQCSECFENYDSPKLLVKHLVTEHVRHSTSSNSDPQLDTTMEILKSEKATFVSFNNGLEKRNSELDNKHVTTIEHERPSGREELQNQLEELSKKLGDWTTSKDTTTEERGSTLGQVEALLVELKAFLECKDTATTYAFQKEGFEKVTNLKNRIGTSERDNFANNTEISNIRSQISVNVIEGGLKDVEVNALKGQLETQKKSTETELKKTQQILEIKTQVLNALQNLFTSLRNTHSSANQDLENKNIDSNLAAMLQSPVMSCGECSLTFRSQLDLLLHLGGKPHATRWALITFQGS